MQEHRFGHAGSTATFLNGSSNRHGAAFETTVNDTRKPGFFFSLPVEKREKGSVWKVSHWEHHAFASADCRRLLPATEESANLQRDPIVGSKESGSPRDFSPAAGPCCLDEL